jgi:hypothetical protein
MLAAQAIEFLWVVLTYLGVEHQSVDPNGYPPLDCVPYLQPRFGLDLAAVPTLDFVVELALSIGCWW